MAARNHLSNEQFTVLKEIATRANLARHRWGQPADYVNLVYDMYETQMPTHDETLSAAHKSSSLLNFDGASNK